VDLVQGYAFEGYERTMDAHIKNVRRKIEADPKKPAYIQTVYGIGYKFSEDGHD
jgi:DNA-binding response OmpR family regulator